MHKCLRTWEFFQLIYRKKAATLIGECCDSVASFFINFMSFRR